MILSQQLRRFAYWLRSDIATAHGHSAEPLPIITKAEPRAGIPKVEPRTGGRVREPRRRERTATIEQMESRALMTADPIWVGGVYVEADVGSDKHGDTFYVTFLGGAAGTQLNRVVIDGDLNSPGFGLGDLFFDTEEGGLGADHAYGFQVVKLTTADPQATVVATVEDGSTRLVLDFTHFRAGDTLEFSIDVDEVQSYDPNETDLAVLNEGFDPITSGVEFQNSLFRAEFSAPHYENVAGQNKFINRYDPVVDPSGLSLPPDDYDGKRDRSAGTALSLVQAPKPISLAGVVYVDNNYNLKLDGGEQRLANVALALYRLEGGVYVSTGFTTKTDSLGNYEFGAALQLPPGNYQVRETQPAGYLSVGATPGVLDGGAPVGQTVSGNPDWLTQIEIPLGDQHATQLNFAEALPAAIAGRVTVVRGAQDCEDEQAIEEPLSGVTVQLWNAAGMLVATQTTDSQGRYQFDNLVAGDYTLKEITPAGLLEGGAHVGSIDAQVVGLSVGGSQIADIRLQGGNQGIHYDFCELSPGSISGRVIADTNENCLIDAPLDRPLAGVLIELQNSQGQVLQTTLTDADGNYRFDNLLPGEYRIREVQPAGYFQGDHHAGSGGGDDSVPDLISQIMVDSGAALVDYSFCELLPGEISGQVFVDLNFDCQRSATEQPLAGVTLELIDAAGQVVGTTLTDANGNYRFTGLKPGTYSVREFQPAGYFQGGQMAPASGGDASQEDVISGLVLGSGEVISEANFCEVPPAKISGYVFQDGPAIVTSDPQDLNLFTVRDGVRTSDDAPIGQVRLQLRTIAGTPIDSSRALPGIYTTETIEVVTDQYGYFEFTGLRAGTYNVYQKQPEGYVDGIDNPGTTGGFGVNKNQDQPSPEYQVLMQALTMDEATNPNDDAILLVSVEPNQQSLNNNFSEVITEDQPPVPPIPPRLLPPPERPFIYPETFPVQGQIIGQQLRWSPEPMLIGVGFRTPPTWHLSVINAGFPRGGRSGQPLTNEQVAEQARVLDVPAWQVEGLKESRWTIVSTLHPKRSAASRMMFDIPGAKPLAGDFNGDGIDELALFINGEWLIDLNGNGSWDTTDIWLRLGERGDQPVVGDWDGDGKDDVGVFGKTWAGDGRAVAAEPGLPDPENLRRIKPKNLPPRVADAPDDPRWLKQGQSGRARADVIDHVFRFGHERNIAIVGDFNGDGISTIGVFNEGQWKIDVDGDGIMTAGRDLELDFGQVGDTPVVGDFNGDGIDELAIVRGSQVIVDSNLNGRIDATDQVFLMESEAGCVVVGDFDGDGRDEPALHQSASQRRTLEARRQ